MPKISPVSVYLLFPVHSKVTRREPVILQKWLVWDAISPQVLVINYHRISAELWWGRGKS